MRRYLFKQTIEINMLGIPAGRRQTSWLCTNAAEELNLKQIQLVVRTGREHGISGFQVFNTLPPVN